MITVSCGRASRAPPVECDPVDFVLVKCKKDEKEEARDDLMVAEVRLPLEAVEVQRGRAKQEMKLRHISVEAQITVPRTLALLRGSKVK